MSNPRDRVSKTLRRALKLLKEYHQIATNGCWEDTERIELVIKEIEKTIIYRS